MDDFNIRNDPLPGVACRRPVSQLRAAGAFAKRTDSMMDKFRAVARQSYLDMGMPKVGREVIGLYSTRKEAEEACIEFVKSRGDSFRTAYDDCIVELVRSS